MADVKLRQVRSANGANASQRATLRSLKLGRIGRDHTMTETAAARRHAARGRAPGRGREDADGPPRSRGDRAPQRSPEAGLAQLAQAASAAARARAWARPPAAATRAPARARARKRKVGYEGGQNPIHMRMRKLRGPNKKMSMPFERFRTHTQPVNVADLEARFDAGARGHARDAARRRPRQAPPPGQGPRPRRDLEEADRARARRSAPPPARRSRRPGAPSS